MLFQFFCIHNVNLCTMWVTVENCIVCENYPSIKYSENRGYLLLLQSMCMVFLLEKLNFCARKRIVQNYTQPKNKKTMVLRETVFVNEEKRFFTLFMVDMFLKDIFSRVIFKRFKWQNYGPACRKKYGWV